MLQNNLNRSNEVILHDTYTWRTGPNVCKHQKKNRRHGKMENGYRKSKYLWV